MLVGYFKLDRPGDFDTDETVWGEASTAECVECGQPVTGLAWVAVMVDESGALYLIGPLCNACASSA